MSDYRGENAEMNIQRLNVRIDQVEFVFTMFILYKFIQNHTILKGVHKFNQIFDKRKKCKYLKSFNTFFKIIDIYSKKKLKLKSKTLNKNI